MIDDDRLNTSSRSLKITFFNCNFEDSAKLLKTSDNAYNHRLILIKRVAENNFNQGIYYDTIDLSIIKQKGKPITRFGIAKNLC